MHLHDVICIGGPLVFGAIVGGLYGTARVMTRKPLPKTTRGWTGSGQTFRLTRYVSFNAPLASELLNLADSGCIEIPTLQRAQVLMEQMFAAEQWLGSRQPWDTQIADVRAQIERMRTLCLDTLIQGFVDKGIDFDDKGLPMQPSLRHALSIIIQTLDAIVFNSRISG